MPDSSYSGTPMEEETPLTTTVVEQNNDASLQEHDTTHIENPLEADAHVSDDDTDPAETKLVAESESESKHEDEEIQPTDQSHQDEPRPSIEADDEMDMTMRAANASRPTSRASSKRSTRVRLESTEETDQRSMNDEQHSYIAHSGLDPENASRTSHNGHESSSQHEGTDEDVFTDRSPRSSLGSYDASSESGKKIDADNMTTITHSSRISDISQYDREDFVPTARGTPRPPFRTPSDVRAMQMSSPPASVHGSPRSSRKHFPSVSRIGTPSASAQYSPKRKSTPPRFKSRPEAPLVLLHVTLLPLRWMWGDLVNNLDPAEMSEQAKTLRDAWRILQDRVGDTVIERGILLGHPQNDYEVLEERLLEALDLPVRRRARILECGHYLGPANEHTLTEDEESGDEFSLQRRQAVSKRHWCLTCKSEIRYDSLGPAKVFRVKVYASNGLMRAGAWEACWKEMERVDVELEPVVEPEVQDEIVRLAAVQQEREIAQQEEAEIAKEVALQYEEQRRSDERLLIQQAHAHAQLLHSSPFLPPPPPPLREPEMVTERIHEPIPESSVSPRRHQDEERLREIYGATPPPPDSLPREASSRSHPDSYIPPPSPQSHSEGAKERRESRRPEYQSASLPALLFQSIRVLMQDRKNVVIVTLVVFVLMLALRSTRTEPHYEPIIHGIKTVPEMQQPPVADTPRAVQEKYRLVEVDVIEPLQVATSSSLAPDSEPSQPIVEYQETPFSSVVESQIETSQPSVQYEETPSSSVASHSEPSQPSLEHQETPSSSVELESEPPRSIVEDKEASSSIEHSPVAIGDSTQVATRQGQETTVSAATTISTVYEPCETSVSSVSSVDAPVSSAASSSSVDAPVSSAVLVSNIPIVEEFETVTEKKIVTEKTVVKVVRTVTETQTQTQTQTETEVEVETATATAFETVLVQPTETPWPEVLLDHEAQTLDSVDDALLVENGIFEDETVDISKPVFAAVDESVGESFIEPAFDPVIEPILEQSAESEEIVENIVED